MFKEICVATILFILIFYDFFFFLLCLKMGHCGKYH
jgi:hypothetical protein